VSTRQLKTGVRLTDSQRLDWLWNNDPRRFA
jgi:hypothetical protein